MSLLTVGLLAATLAAGPERVSVAILQPGSADATAALATAMQERANELLASTGHAYVFHARQTNSMLARHQMSTGALADPNGARKAAERLDAQRFVFSKLTPTHSGWVLELTSATVGTVQSVDAKVDLPKGEALAVEQGATALAASIEAGLRAGPPPTTSDGAMRAFAQCDAALLGQPIGIETPPLLDRARLKLARSACEAAVKQDPQFVAAQGALDLLRAIAGERIPAGAASPNLNGVLARFWAAAHLESVAAGETVLKNELHRDPSNLLTLTYLAELYNATGRQAEAATTWRELAAISPSSPFVMSRLAYTLARLGGAAEAASIAERAMAFDPESIDLQLELAGRYLDAGKADKAAAVLRPLVARADVRPEAILRLGYAQYLLGDFAAAEASATRARAAATQPADWRTHARANVDLARLALHEGKPDQARALLLQAQREGLSVRDPPASDVALFRLWPAGGASGAHPQEASPVSSPE